MAMICDFCNSEPGLLLISNQENGDTQSTGSNCIPEFLKQMSIVYGVWPKIEDVLTDELVREEGIKRGLISEKLESAVKATAKRTSSRKPANAGAETLAESAAVTRAGIEPTDYDKTPDWMDGGEGQPDQSAEGRPGDGGAPDA